MSPLATALRKYDAAGRVVTLADGSTLPNKLERFMFVVEREPPILAAVRSLPVVDFDAFYTAAKATGGSMVGSCRLDWPLAEDDRLAMQLALMRELAAGRETLSEFSSKFMYADTYDGQAYKFLTQVFEPFATELREWVVDHTVGGDTAQNSASNGVTEDKALATARPSSRIRLFVSHASHDEVFVRHLMDVLIVALPIPREHIRCTSVAGFKLPAGSRTSDQLRVDIENADVMLAVISGAAVQSMYVLFEMGARWGVDRPLFPVLAPDAAPSIMRAPLTELHAIRANASDLQQLITDLARILSVQPARPETYQRHLDALLSYGLSMGAERA